MWSREPGVKALITILVVGALLRAIGIDYGLPAVFNPDEVAIMNRALAFSSGDLNPNNFVYPTLFFYVLFVWEGAAFVAGRLTGVFDSLAAFERSYFVDPTFIFIAGRALSVVCGVATIWVTYLLGSRLWNRAAGIAAACLLAVAPLAVRDAHYVKHDVPVTLLIVVAHWWLARLLFPDVDTSLPRNRWASWAVAGALAGLAVSTHYYAVFAVLPVGVAIVLSARRRETPVPVALAHLVVAGAAAVMTFALTSPFLVLHPERAWADIVANREIVVDRAVNAEGPFASLMFYLDWLVRDGSGAVVAALAIAGVVLVAARADRRMALLLVFPLSFLLFISNTVPASRYLNPLLPFVALLAAATLAHLSAKATVARRWLVALLFVAAVGEGAIASGRANRVFLEVDTRTRALEWMTSEVPAESSVLVQPYSVPLVPSRAGLIEALTLHVGSVERASVRFRRQLAVDPYPAPAYRLIYAGRGGLDTDKIYLDPLALAGPEGEARLREKRIDYVIVKRSNVPDPAFTGLDGILTRQGVRVAEFSPYRATATTDARARVPPFLHNTDGRFAAVLERPGPVIEIWKLD